MFTPPVDRLAKDAAAEVSEAERRQQLRQEQRVKVGLLCRCTRVCVRVCVSVSVHVYMIETEAAAATGATCQGGFAV